MSRLVGLDEAFMFPTHLSGEISAAGAVRLTAFNGTDIVQATEGRFDPRSTHQDEEGVPVHPVHMRDAFSNPTIDGIAARINPRFGVSHAETPELSWAHYTTIDCQLGELAQFCYRTTEQQDEPVCATLVITPGYANLIIYVSVVPRASCLWYPVAGDEGYITQSIFGEHEPNEDLLQEQLVMTAKGVTTCCSTLSKLCPMAVAHSAPGASLDDLRNQN